MPKYVASWDAEQGDAMLSTWDGICQSTPVLHLYIRHMQEAASRGLSLDVFYGLDYNSAGVVYEQRPDKTVVYGDHVGDRYL